MVKGDQPERTPFLFKAFDTQSVMEGEEKETNNNIPVQDSANKIGAAHSSSTPRNVVAPFQTHVVLI